jgi:hypothetical protein
MAIAVESYLGHFSPVGVSIASFVDFTNAGLVCGDAVAA